MLMADDMGWSDFGAYAGGGKALGHPTPNIDRLAKEGRCSPAGTANRVARQGAPRSLPDAFRSARRYRLLWLRATGMG